MSSSILIVPSVTKGNGSGHIVRCLSLARSLGPGAAVYAPEAKAETIWSAAEISLAYAREAAGVKILSRLGEPGEQAGAWDLVVLDRRATAVEELAFWERLGPVLAVDEGGEARERAHYLVDILPRHPAARGGRANLSGIGLLPLPRSRREPPRSFRRVLVSFGGEDSAGLSLALARSLVYERLVEPSDLTVVSGALRRGAPPAGLDGATLLGPVQDLKEHLHRYDLVLTQFGLTAFEAAWAGCGVVLLNPSKYHRELARAAGFPEIGVIRPDTQALRRLMSSPAEVLAALAPMLPAEPESLADRVGELVPAGPRDCPACSSPDRAALYRGRAKSYFRCASCGALYMTRFGSPDYVGAGSGGAAGAARYGKSYFFEEYKRQYGRTYLEDWPALARMADSRLRSIESAASRSLGRSRGLSILDVGCAYGPFLQRARERGHEPRGLDVSEDAVAYVRGELGIPAFAGDFLDQDVASPLGGPFDALTMWYVVEHFADLGRALRNASAIVRPGGILALSTPSGEGASALFARERFFESSPGDHYTIWEPSRARALLKAFGFRVARIRITGHHPERLPGLRFLARPEGRTSGGVDGGAGGGALRRAAAAIGAAVSRLAGLGDTFEVYAVREPALVPRAAASGFRGPGRRAADREDEAWGERRGAHHKRGR